MRKWGLADAVGIIVALVILAWMPGVMDPASYPKLLVLVAGGLALIPSVVDRWSRLKRPGWLVLVPLLAALGILIWTFVATIVSTAPISVRLFGWWVRADGALGIVAAVVILLAAVSLSRSEVQRAIDWLLVGAGVVSLLGIPQLLGADFLAVADGTVGSTLGQINFSGAYFAIMAPLALARAFTAPSRGWRIACAVLALAVAFLSVASTSLQGPMSLAAAAVGFGMAWVLTYRGRRRIALTTASIVVFASGLLVAVAGMLSVGPLGFVGREGNTQWRYAMWAAGWETVQGHPVLGIGPGSFARYISEFRPLETVVRAGESMRPSAVHSIPLQFGIALGWPGLILWLVLFVGVVVGLVVLLTRTTAVSRMLVVGVCGAVLAYLTQAVVSIDVPSILAIGWVLAGLSLALVRCGDTPEQDLRVQGRPGRVLGVSVVLGVIGAIAVGTQILSSEQVRSVTSKEEAVAVLQDATVPCPLRVQLANEVLSGQSFDFALPVAQAAFAVDERCPPFVDLVSQIAIEANAPQVAGPSTLRGVQLDPMSSRAWDLRADFLRRTGDSAGADEAAARATYIRDAIAAGNP